MRDYAEIGWRVVSGGGNRQRGRVGVLSRAWQTLGSPATTTVLVLLLGGLPILDAGSAKNTLPIEDPTQFGPMGMRVVLALLTLNFAVVFLSRVLPALVLGSAHPEDLELASAVEHRAPIPFVDDDLELSRSLSDAGAAAARRSGGRRAFGVTGRISLIGASLGIAGGLVLMMLLSAGLDDPPHGALVLREGLPTEVLQYDRDSQKPLDTYLGFSFTVLESDALASSLRGEEVGEAALVVRNLADDSVQQLALGTGSRVGLPDGTMLSLQGAREISEPAEATVVVRSASGATTEQAVRVGTRLEVDGKPVLTVRTLTWDFLDSLGPAVQFADGSGRTFWLFQNAPSLMNTHGAAAGASLELASMRPGLEVHVARVPRQEGPLAIIGVCLLLVGAGLLLSRTHLAVDVVDEVDRIVVRGTSINDAVSLSEALAEVSDGLAGVFGDEASEMHGRPTVNEEEPATRDVAEAEDDAEEAEGADEDDAEEAEADEDDDEEAEADEDDAEEADEDEDDDEEAEADEDDAEEAEADEDDAEEAEGADEDDAEEAEADEDDDEEAEADDDDDDDKEAT